MADLCFRRAYRAACDPRFDLDDAWVSGGGGPITSGVEKAIWPVLNALSGKQRRLPGVAGPLILLLIIGTWVLLIWAGWFLIFSSDPTMVISSASMLPADWMERLYFSGYTIFTLGNGGFQAGTYLEQVATAPAAGAGLFAITLAITYLLSLISAAVSARALASQVSTLGDKPADALVAAWNGQDYSDLRYSLQTLTQQLAQFGEQHLAYPVLQFFHARQPATLPSIALVRLEQLIAVAEHGIPAATRPPYLLLKATRSSIDQIVEVLSQQFTRRSAGELPLPGLSPLIESGLPVQTTDELALGLESRIDTRRKLASLIRSHNWRITNLQLAG